MIIKSDTLYQRKVKYPSKKTAITKLMGDNEDLVTTITSFTMLDNFTQLYRFRRLFKVVELKW